ncbi:DUF421 domain-containing protein [Tuberibacillus calidus]|uniref:DUF421 domain-containing protein n=1 Tax=Tuberibacillus calidus TaxID=340097 RepID=UPI0003F95DBB|nr:DUF421 domain-containing protein [Tuberibacillus calidus]
MHFWEISARTVITFFVLLFFARLLGRKQISNLTFFNYITGISIGTIASSISMDRSQNLWDAALALVGWVTLTLVISLLDIKSRRMRLLLDGEPVIVIKNGQVLKNTLKRIHLDMEQLMMMLREKSVFTVNEVDYAIIETDGKLSLLKKEAHQSPAKKDLGIPAATTGFIPTDLIIDGKLLMENLHRTGITEAWVKQQLAHYGIPDVREVFYAQLQKDGTLYVDLMDKAPEAN